MFAVGGGEGALTQPVQHLLFSAKSDHSVLQPSPGRCGSALCCQDAIFWSDEIETFLSA